MARTKIKTARFLSRVIDIAVLSVCLSVTLRSGLNVSYFLQYIVVLSVLNVCEGAFNTDWVYKCINVKKLLFYNNV